MSVRAATDERGSVQSLRSAFDVFNEMVRTEGDVLAFVRQFFDPRAEYRPIEDPDWFSDPDAIARSLQRWIDTWAVGSYRIEPEEILEFDDDRFVVVSRTRGVGRGSGVPIEAVTYIACIWRDDRFWWFDEYSERAGALAAAGRQTPETGGTASGDRGSLAERLARVGEAAFAAYVRRRSDRQLERVFGSGPALRGVFKRMEQVFAPVKASDFRGEIQYELIGPHGVAKWVVRIDGDRAMVRPGEAPTPAVTTRMRLALFIRIAARQVHPAKAFREGWVEVTGDFETAARVAAMFGLSR